MGLFDRPGIPASLHPHHYENDSGELDANHDIRSILSLLIYYIGNIL